MTSTNNIILYFYGNTRQIRLECLATCLFSLLVYDIFVMFSNEFVIYVLVIYMHIQTAIYMT